MFKYDVSKYSYVSSVEGSGGMPNLFELARVRVIVCSSYRHSTVVTWLDVILYGYHLLKCTLVVLFKLTMLNILVS